MTEEEIHKTHENIRGRNAFTAAIMVSYKFKIPKGESEEFVVGFRDHARLYGYLDRIIEESLER